MTKYKLWNRKYPLLQRKGQNDAEEKAEKRYALSSHLRSESGVALVVVLILSAISLALMTALIYMITIGTQTSGMQKRYRTALEAGIAGSDLLTQVIAQRGDMTAINSFITDLNTYGLTAANAVPLGCTGVTLAGSSQQGLPAKIMSSSTTWAGCNSSLTINPADSTTYDFRFQLGSSPQFTVYTKIVDVVEGNTGGSGIPATRLRNDYTTKSNSGGGEITVMSIPYLYTMEVDAENTTSGERAKLSVLYQY